MRPHKIICTLTTIIFVSIVILTIFIFKTNYFENELYKIIGYFILVILILFYPISFYTYWRLISDENYKGVFLYGLIKISSNVSAIFVVPFILSFIFVPDYIRYFMFDLKQHKNERNE